MKVDLAQNVRLVVSLWRYVVSSFRCGVSSFRHSPARLVVFRGRLGELPVRPQASQAKNTWCKGQFVYIENCMGKSPIMKKCVINYLI